MEDRYETLDVIARGAMATVWRARDVRLGRTVAIKRPDARDGDPGEAAFVTAARSAAAVTHPNLVTIFDTGTDDEGTYLVMELVEGPTLAEMGGAPGEIAPLGSDIASGLAALHAAGIVHRAVKPSNILLGPTGVKLTDFGTARTLAAADRSSVGTPRFVAPEVLAGGEPAAAADVYSLGAVLAWLTGQTRPDPALSSIIAEATTDDPGARPTAAALAERLGAIATGQSNAVVPVPVVAPPPDDATRVYDTAPVPQTEATTEEDTPSSRRRLAAVIALASVALIAVMILLAGDGDDATLAEGTTTTIAEPGSTTAPPSETDAPTTTVEEEDSGGVFNTIRVFVTFIRETPGEVLSSTGADEIISDVVDGVSEAIQGNDEEAESSLADAVETVEGEIESESVVDRAVELITRLARQLGLDIERAVEPSG